MTTVPSSASTTSIMGATAEAVRVGVERIPWPVFDDNQQQYMSLSEYHFV